MILDWQIIAAMPENNNLLPKTEVTSIVHTANKNRRLLVVGNEGEGLTPSIIEKCNVFENISPGRRLHPYVDSLNVSVATALLVERLLRNHDLPLSQKSSKSTSAATPGFRLPSDTKVS